METIWATRSVRILMDDLSLSFSEFVHESMVHKAFVLGDHDFLSDSHSLDNSDQQLHMLLALRHAAARYRACRRVAVAAASGV